MPPFVLHPDSPYLTLFVNSSHHFKMCSVGYLLIVFIVCLCPPAHSQQTVLPVPGPQHLQRPGVQQLMFVTTMNGSALGLRLVRDANSRPDGQRKWAKWAKEGQVG